MAQDPIADRNAVARARVTLAEAWNGTFVGRYIKSHHISRTALVGAAISVAILFFAVGAALRLLVGPISLGPLSGQISDALAQALPGITVKYDQAAVEWSRDQGRVNLVVLGARVFDTKGRIIAQAPQMDIDLAAQPFISGKIVVTRITLVGVQLTLVRNVDGTLRLGVEHDDSQRDIISRITDAINKNSTSASSLQSFAIRDARVAFMDESTGMFLVAPKADVRIATEGEKLIASLVADIEVSGRAAHIVGQVALPPRAGPVYGKIQVTGLDIAALGNNAKMFHFLRSIAMVADFSSNFAIEGTHLLGADFAVSAAGNATIIGIRHTVNVARLHLAGRYDRAKARISLQDATLDSNLLRAHLVGGMNLVYDSGGAITRLGVDLTADKTALAMPGTFAQPVFVPLASLHGSYVPATHDILIDSLNTTGGALVLAASGRITLVEAKSPVLELKGRVEPLAVRDMLHYWPLDMGAGARDWIDRNIFSGSLGAIVFETHLPAGAFDAPAIPDSALLMTFPITNAELNYVRGLTHMTGVFANARLTGNSFSADVNRGRIGPLLVSRGHAVIPDLSLPAAPGEITAHLDGSMTDILKLTDMKPLNYATRFGLDPASTAGKAGIDLDFHVPMRRDLNVDDIGISVKAAVTGFGISLSKTTRLTDGAVNFDIDNTHLHATGAVGLATSRLTVDWVEDFRNAGISSKIAIKGAMDQAAREMLGISGINDYLRGPIGVTGTLAGHRGQIVSADLALDLSAATLSLDLVGIAKPAGFPASGHATAVFGPHSTIQSESMTINAGPSLQTTMALTFNAEGHLATLSAPSVKSGSTNDFSFLLTRAATGIDIVVKGHSVDGTQIARRGSGTSGGAANVGGKPSGKVASDIDGPFHIDAKLDRVVLRNNVAIAPFALDVTGVADRPVTMTLSGKVAKTGTLTGSIAPAGGDRRLTLDTSDIGTLARGLFGFTSMKGGNLDLTATLHGSGTAVASDDSATDDYQGTLDIKDFRLLNQPFLARLFSAGSLVGFGNLLQGGGIEVDHLKVPFSANNGVLAIHTARATGPAIGISAEGYIDRPKNEIALKGTLVPLFGLNTVLGYIPFLGNLLISKPGEGIIGMTYTVSGNADEPKISVNPLSLVTPGIFRRIFEGKMPNAADAQSNAPPSQVVVTPQGQGTKPGADSPKPQ
ncbi:MAG TPA: AsmA-like C-terminal domain-containing protein [Rhizomicrobium sp.]|nr:AsmA-like C-terminal domain-containing protein [Rhizomicrobium sp.]